MLPHLSGVPHLHVNRLLELRLIYFIPGQECAEICGKSLWSQIFGPLE